MRNCLVCGKECFGRVCRKCFKTSKSHGSVSRCRKRRLNLQKVYKVK